MARRWLAIFLVLMSSLACTLTVSDDDSSTPASSEGDEVADSGGGVPTVQIVSPGAGQQVRLGTDVEISVVATGQTGVSRVQLSVGGRLSSTKSFPESATTAEALLRWRPDREGTFELSVVAYQGSTASAPATLNLQVVGRADPVSNPVSNQPNVSAPAGECVARVLIGNLRRRTGPGTNFDHQGNFDLNEQLAVVGQNGNGEWVRVRRGSGIENWASNNRDWIELVGACTGLPVLN